MTINYATDIRLKDLYLLNIQAFLLMEIFTESMIYSYIENECKCQKDIIDSK